MDMSCIKQDGHISITPDNSKTVWSDWHVINFLMLIVQVVMIVNAVLGVHTLFPLRLNSLVVLHLINQISFVFALLIWW